jgi:hypothetical protein
MRNMRRLQRRTSTRAFQLTPCRVSTGWAVCSAKYVDELITPEVVAWFTEAVSSKYSGCTSGPWDTLLGMLLGFGVVHDRANRTVKVSARKLIHDLARRRGFTI